MLMNAMFRLFERVLDPTAQPARPEPPTGLVAFYWHFAPQARSLFVALLWFRPQGLMGKA